MEQPNLHPLFVALLAGAFAGLSASAMAADFKIGEEANARINATATLGTIIRTEAPDPASLGGVASARVGGPAGQLAGNTGGNDLNFQKNHAVSTVVKTLVDVEIKWRNWGVFARAKAWNDFELADGDRAYGNSTGGFARNVPLSDQGFDPAAKFSNIVLADAYAFGRFDLAGDHVLDARLGRQVLNWGALRLLTGGLEALDARDIPAQVRPGALPHEGRIPAGTFTTSASPPPTWRAMQPARRWPSRWPMWPIWPPPSTWASTAS